MTKKQESPFQISLDIPVSLLQGQEEANVETLRESQSSPLNPVHDEHRLGTAYEELLEPASTTSLHGTQISLLDEWSRAHPDQEHAVVQVVPPSGHDSGSKASPSNPSFSPVHSAIATPTASLISTPYLLPVGTIIASPGGHFSYRVLGACCRLFDRDELPWPCCRIQWRSKEPSWRRIGKRFVPDLATKRFPSYMVEILDPEYSREPFVLTLYWLKCPPDVQDWWYTKYVPPSAQRLKR